MYKLKLLLNYQLLCYLRKMQFRAELEESQIPSYTLHSLKINEALLYILA